MLLHRVGSVQRACPVCCASFVQCHSPPASACCFLIRAALPCMRFQKKLRDQKPWATDPKYFTHVKISALALLKMVRKRFVFLLRPVRAFVSSVSPGRPGMLRILWAGICHRHAFHPLREFVMSRPCTRDQGGR